nr:uncharacterized protein CI109_003578 [Kwoniella shandongensis]KAA5527925.1 hypothetical protein CI109_003578 [Kwoniella shandongensis]
MSSNNQGNSSSRGMRRANAVRARNRSSSQGDSLTHFDPVSASIAQGDYSTSASQSVSGVSASLRGPSDFATASEAVSYPQYNYSQSGDPAGSVGTPAPPYVTNASSSSQSATDGTSTSTGVDAPPKYATLYPYGNGTIYQNPENHVRFRGQSHTQDEVNYHERWCPGCTDEFPVRSSRTS